MLQQLLISRADVREFVQISETIYDDVFNGIVLKTQIKDVAPLLGEKLFNHLLTNPTATDNLELLNGGSYTESGLTYFNYGLKAVIAYYFDARYKMFGSAIDTPFSLVDKINGDSSRPVSDKTKETLFIENQKIAFTIWKSVENYLIRTKNTYFQQDLLRCDFKQNESTFKFKKV